MWNMHAMPEFLRPTCIWFAYFCSAENNFHQLKGMNTKNLVLEIALIVLGLSLWIVPTISRTYLEEMLRLCMEGRNIYVSYYRLRTNTAPKFFRQMRAVALC